MLKVRVLSAVIGVPVILGIMYTGGVYWRAFFILLGIAALFEFYNMMKNRNFTPLVVPGFLLLLLLLFSPLYPGYVLEGFFLITVFIVIELVVKYPDITVNEVSLSLFGPAYAGLLLSYAVRMADLNDAFMVMLLACILTWSSDVGGYVFGVTWGKHKMTPELSPNKTWEGALAGIVLSAVFSFVFFNLWGIAGIHFAYAILLGIIASVMAQLGDLFMSGVKRYFGVKDTGNIIPGHGGVLDRFDSFLLVVPLVYYFFVLFV